LEGRWRRPEEKEGGGEPRGEGRRKGFYRKSSHSQTLLERSGKGGLKSGGGESFHRKERGEGSIKL